MFVAMFLNEHIFSLQTIIIIQMMHFQIQLNTVMIAVNEDLTFLLQTMHFSEMR